MIKSSEKACWLCQYYYYICVCGVWSVRQVIFSTTKKKTRLFFALDYLSRCRSVAFTCVCYGESDIKIYIWQKRLVCNFILHVFLLKAVEKKSSYSYNDEEMIDRWIKNYICMDIYVYIYYAYFLMWFNQII